MANLVVQSTANCINVDFNDLAALTGFENANFNKSQITFQIKYNENYVRVFDSFGVNWAVTYATNPGLLAGLNALPIDTVDGVSASSNLELYNLLVAMKG